ncbi:hypothetical protein [Pseudoalteromonas sp. SG41-6]|uniref:hypothetical protein n=2 Tax=Pseudoalteromonas TaxID=53246 RepID=UPI001601E760|nr:hypothetical protein [Pseudoalteromonas sp. SG41-6]
MSMRTDFSFMFRFATGRKYCTKREINMASTLITSLPSLYSLLHKTLTLSVLMRIIILFMFLSCPSHAVVKEHYIEFTFLTEAEQKEFRSKAIKSKLELLASELDEGREQFFTWCLGILGDECCNQGWKNKLEKLIVQQRKTIESMNTSWDEDTSWKSYIHKNDLSFWFPELVNTDDVRVDYGNGDFIFFDSSGAKKWLLEIACNESNIKELALCSFESSEAGILFNTPMKFEGNVNGEVPLVIPADEQLAHLLIEQRSSMVDLHSDEGYFKEAEFGSITQYEKDWRINFYKGNCISYETFYFAPEHKKFIYLNHGLGRYSYCK